MSPGSAGIGYGAHGVWQWHREGGEFTNPGFSLQPFPWQSAVHFRGADDISLLAWLLARHRLYRLDADQGLLVDAVGGVRAASSSDGALVAVYQPFARDVTVRGDLTDFTVDIDRTYELLSDVPAGKTVVSESGFSTREQLDDLDRVGIDAVLVGETLMRAEDIEAACRALAAGHDFDA